MKSSEDGTAFDKQVLEVYVSGLQSELETKLRDLRRVQQAIERLTERRDGVEQVEMVRALAGELDRMLVTNRVVRETLLQLRETTHQLLQGLLNAKRS